MNFLSRHITLRAVTVFLILTLLSPQSFSEDATSEEPEDTVVTKTAISFTDAIQSLQADSFHKKAEAIDAFLNLNDPRALPVLHALLDSKLYYRTSDDRVVIIDQTDAGYAIKDAANGQPFGIVEKQTIKKIKTNNSLRKKLRTAIAGLSLSNPDALVRVNAVKIMLAEISEDNTSLFREALFREKDEDVRELLKVGMALAEIDSEDRHTRLTAIAGLSESLLPEARNRLHLLVQKDTDGNTVEQDKAVVESAERALKKITTKVDFYNLIETIFFGVSLGSVLLLAAIGLAITFGVMGVINMAHGELIMIGAYTTYIIQLLMPNNIDLSVLIAIPAAFLVAGFFGILIERSVIRFLYGRPLETLLATFGISLILQQLVRTTISSNNVVVETPSWMSGTWQVNAALSLTFNRLYIILFSLMVFFALLAILKKTPLGLQIRAVSQNRKMAKALGIRSEWVDALTFGLGSGIAGVAGVALSQLTNVGPNLGQAYIIDSFMVVVFGGVGNLWGTLVGALSLGVVNKFLEPWAGAVLAKILVLVFIILFIQKRPKGLFPKKGRAAEN